MNDHVLVCPQCYIINQVLFSDFFNLPVCTRCEALLLPETAIEVNEKVFNIFISHSTLPVVVDFWGPWSGISHEMADVITLLAHTFKNDAIFLRVNGEQEQVLANDYKLLDIPTFILFISGLEYHRLHGSISECEFHCWLERYLRIKRKKEDQHPSFV